MELEKIIELPVIIPADMDIKTLFARLAEKNIEIDEKYSRKILTVLDERRKIKTFPLNDDPQNHGYTSFGIEGYMLMDKSKQLIIILNQMKSITKYKVMFSGKRDDSSMFDAAIETINDFHELEKNRYVADFRRKEALARTNL